MEQEKKLENMRQIYKTLLRMYTQKTDSQNGTEYNWIYSYPDYNMCVCKNVIVQHGTLNVYPFTVVLNIVERTYL